MQQEAMLQNSFLKWEPNPSALFDSWNDWKAKYNKKYGHDGEAVSFINYKKNIIFLHDHNEKFAKGQVSFKVSSNGYMDLNTDSFTQMYLTDFP